jgi:hypothetical protein
MKKNTLPDKASYFNPKLSAAAEHLGRTTDRISGSPACVLDRVV